METGLETIDVNAAVTAVTGGVIAATVAVIEVGRDEATTKVVSVAAAIAATESVVSVLMTIVDVMTDKATIANVTIARVTIARVTIERLTEIASNGLETATRRTSVRQGETLLTDGRNLIDRLSAAVIAGVMIVAPISVKDLMRRPGGTAIAAQTIETPANGRAIGMVAAIPAVVIGAISAMTDVLAAIAMIVAMARAALVRLVMGMVPATGMDIFARFIRSSTTMLVTTLMDGSVLRTAAIDRHMDAIRLNA